MKKLFAIVMVLAMALAIAAPALASGWDALPTTTPTFKDITIKITALETEKNTSVLGSLYEQLKVMYPVVKGTDVHFFVEITVPAAANLSTATKALIDYKGLEYTLETSNLKLTKGFSYVDGGSKTAFSPLADDEDAWTITGFGAKVVYGYEYWAKGIEAGKDGVAVATIGFYNVWDAGVFAWDNDADGEDEFFVDHTVPDEFLIVKNNADYDSLLFPTDDTTGKVDATREMILTYDGVEYAVNRSVTNDITFRDGTYVYNPGDTSGVTYATLKTAFDSFFTALGFGYPEAKYMTEDHFTKYFGTIMETSVKIVYPSGAVVVAPPAVTPPQTGDATTVVGFVMIALALVAAAAVTVRKVRA